MPSCSYRIGSCVTASTSRNVWGAPASGISRLRVSLACRNKEQEWFRELAEWARDHVRLLEALHQRVKSLPGAIVRDGPRIRAKAWARLAGVSDRRADLYALETSPLGALIAHVARGDYGRRSRGGLGMTSFGRDALHGLGVLERLPAQWGEPGVT